MLIKQKDYINDILQITVNIIIIVIKELNRSKTGWRFSTEIFTVK